ncbi:guanylate kinase, partial [Candidatus Pelagibacter sp.]|nr:guanylate kinase [Candidatus Pelagibacter sp.]
MSSFKKGGMFILSSPSGAGKTTLVKKISKEKGFITSISHTTRLPRPKEKNGKDYYFISKNYFKKLIKKKEFLEHAKVFENYYGSSKKIVLENLKKGKNIIFDIDWQGTRQIRNKKL